RNRQPSRRDSSASCGIGTRGGAGALDATASREAANVATSIAGVQPSPAAAMIRPTSAGPEIAQAVHVNGRTTCTGGRTADGDDPDKVPDRRDPLTEPEAAEDARFAPRADVERE